MKTFLVVCLCGILFSNAVSAQKVDSQPVIVTTDKKQGKGKKGDVIILVTTNLGGQENHKCRPHEGIVVHRNPFFQTMRDTPLTDLEYWIGTFTDSTMRFIALVSGGSGPIPMPGGWAQEDIPKPTPLQVYLQSYLRKREKEVADSLAMLAQKMLPKLESRLAAITQELEVTDLKTVNPDYLEELDRKITAFEQSKAILARK